MLRTLIIAGLSTMTAAALGCGDQTRATAAGGASASSLAPQPPHATEGAQGDPDGRPSIYPRYVDQHSDIAGLRPDLMNASFAQFSRMGRLTNQLPPGLSFASWAELGPAPSRAVEGAQGYRLEGGIVWDIAIDPRVTGADARDRVIYLASDGGIWKSQDGGASWQPKSDRLGTQWFGAVALDRGDPNLVYAGSGNVYHPLGNGIFRSADGGTTWTGPYGQAAMLGKAITHIVSPAANELLVGLQVELGEGGLYRSTDGGRTFRAIAVPSGATSTGNISDLRLSTSNDSYVYVAVEGRGVFRSMDRGATFSANLFSNPGAPSNYKWVSLGQGAPPNNTVMYAAVQVEAPEGAWLYKSTNSGASWARVSNFPGDQHWYQGPYDQIVGVDPRDVNFVYVGLAHGMFSRDGGSTWTLIREWDLHPDHHLVTYSPASHTQEPAMYVGTDGGLSKMLEGQTVWSWLNTGLVNSLLYRVDMGRGSDANRTYTYGGFQDQGSQVLLPGLPGLEWSKFDGGDNFIVAVDPYDPQHVFTAAGFKQSWDAGRTLSSVKDSLRSEPAKLVFDPNVGPPLPSRLYAVPSERNGELWVTNDSANSFTLMHDFGRSIVAVAPSRGTPDVLWVALEDNSIWRTTGARQDAASDWQASPAPPGSPTDSAPTALAVDPRDANVAVAVYPTYSALASPAATRHVWLSTDGNASWRDISGSQTTQSVPDLVLYDVVFDASVNPSAILIASDFGLLRSDDRGATWDVVGRGMPAVQTLSLAIDDSRSPAVLRAGTYGRGVLELRTSAQLDVQVQGNGGQCLEAPSNSNGTPVHMASCQASPGQKWTLTPEGELRVLDGKCLDVRGPSDANGTVVQVWDCVGVDNQRWRLLPSGNLVGYAGKCLDVDTQTPNGQKVQLWSCLGPQTQPLPNQTWSAPQ